MTTPLTPTSILPLEAGSILSGIILAITVQEMYRSGISLRITSDRDRQKFLLLIIFIGTLCAIVSLGLNQTHQSWIANDVAVFTEFILIQIGLAVINHNTIVRFYLAKSDYSGDSRKVNRYCVGLYVLCFAALTPIYFAFIQATPNNNPINKAPINANVYKPLNIALVVSTEVLATISDIILLRKMWERSFGPSAQQSLHKNNAFRSMLQNYIVIWGSLIFDVLIKILIAEGFPVLFDSVITMLSLALRAAANLKYGTTLKEVSEMVPSHPSGIVSSGSEQGSRPPNLTSTTDDSKYAN